MYKNRKFAMKIIYHDAYYYRNWRKFQNLKSEFIIKFIDQFPIIEYSFIDCIITEYCEVILKLIYPVLLSQWT